VDLAIGYLGLICATVSVQLLPVVTFLFVPEITVLSLGTAKRNIYNLGAACRWQINLSRTGIGIIQFCLNKKHHS
jgi:hypothetical protein